MHTVVPEIRIHSPSDHGENDSSDSFHGTSISCRQDKCAPNVFGASVEDTVPWETTLNMRVVNIAAFPSACNGTLSRAQNLAIQRAKVGCCSNPSKSLDILRELLQNRINAELDKVIQKYVNLYFRQGIENIRINNGPYSVNDNHMPNLCRQILEEAKKMYETSSGTRCTSPASDADFARSASPVTELRKKRRKQHNYRERDDDSDSGTSQNHMLYVPSHRKSRGGHHSSGRSTPSSTGTGRPRTVPEPVRREGFKWDPSRLSTQTLFVMGSKANKALGLGAQRGRLYIKHQDLFRYSGDLEDKQWLYEQHLMPAAGGRAFLLIVDDIIDLANSDEYRNCSGVDVSDLKGFSVPQFMITKMQAVMQSQRTDLGSIVKKKSTSKNRLSVVDGMSDLSSNKTSVDQLSATGSTVGEASPFSGVASPAPSEVSVGAELSTGVGLSDLYGLI